jgi:hypothetical protein
MSQQSKLASWQQLKAQTVTSIVEEPSTQEIILTPSITEQEILVDLTVQSENLDNSSIPDSTSVEESNIETVKKSNKKGTVNV